MKTSPQILALLAAMLASGVHAEVPRLLSFQGRLSDGGSPVTTSTSADLSLYTTDTGGSAVWTETGEALLPDSNGTFVTTLGDQVDLPARLFSERLWLGVTPQGSSELSPRLPLLASPYAVAATAQTGGLPNTTPLPLISFADGAGAIWEPDQVLEGVGKWVGGSLQVVTPTSRWNRITKADLAELVCIGRIEPWTDIQTGDEVAFLFDGNAQAQFLSFVNQPFAEATTLANNGDSFYCTEFGFSCAAVGGCNIRGPSTQPGMEFGAGMREKYAQVRFTYVDGYFYPAP